MQRTVLLLILCVTACFSQTLTNGNRVVEGSLNYCEDTGSSGSYACSLSPAISLYVSGAQYCFKANTANSGAATLNLNGLGAKAIKKPAGGITTDLAPNDIQPGQRVCAIYDGLNMQMLSQLGNASAGANSPALGCSFDGGGSPVTVGSICYSRAVFGCTITSYSIIATGSSPTATVDIYKAPAGTVLPTSSITAAAKPALATGNAVSSSTLTGWTTAVSANDILAFHIDALANATTLEIKLKCQ